jgi:hypothetical protein
MQTNAIKTYFVVKHLQRHFLNAVTLLTNKQKSHYLTGKCLFSRRDYIYVWCNNSAIRLHMLSRNSWPWQWNVRRNIICQQGTVTHVHVSRNGVCLLRATGSSWQALCNQRLQHSGELALAPRVCKLRSIDFLVAFEILSTATMEIPGSVIRMENYGKNVENTSRPYIFFETSVNFNRIIRRHIQQGSNSAWNIILLKLTANRHLFWSENRVVCWWKYRALFMVNTFQSWDNRCYDTVQQIL